jgi:hypothetical protein
MVRNLLESLGEGFRKPLGVIGCGVTGPLLLGGKSPAEYLGSRAIFLGGPALSPLGRSEAMRRAEVLRPSLVVPLG